MHTDSRNPVVYISGLKAKLENLERKHAKLKRRHENLGIKFLNVNNGMTT